MPLTIDHTAIVVPASQLDGVVNFLLAALKPLGLKEMMRPIPNSVGLGDQTPFFWVTGIEGDAKTPEAVMKNEHTAFTAASRLLPGVRIVLLETNANGTCRQRACRQIL
jgi:hypothetical protein